MFVTLEFSPFWLCFLSRNMKIRYIHFLIKTLKKTWVNLMKTYFLHILKNLFSKFWNCYNHPLFLVKLILPVHSHFNPVILLHPYEEHSFISTSRKYELNLRCVQHPRKLCRILFCWKSPGYWLNPSVWQNKTSGL